MGWLYAVPLLIGLGLIVLAWRAWRPVTIYDWDQGVLYVHGKFERILPPGRYRFFGLGDRVQVETVRALAQVEQVSPIDVVSADGFSYRIGLAVLFKVKDARGALLDRARMKFRLLLTEAAVAAAAKMTLKAFMEDRAAASVPILAALSPGLPEYEFETVAITAVTLPPEIRRLMTEVERARLEGLAALERARGEQATLRALANAARLLKENPGLAHLRTLKAFESAKSGTLVVGADAPWKG